MLNSFLRDGCATTMKKNSKKIDGEESFSECSAVESCETARFSADSESFNIFCSDSLRECEEYFEKETQKIINQTETNTTSSEPFHINKQYQNNIEKSKIKSKYDVKFTKTLSDNEVKVTKKLSNEIIQDFPMQKSNNSEKSITNIDEFSYNSVENTNSFEENDQSIMNSQIFSENLTCFSDFSIEESSHENKTENSIEIPIDFDSELISKKHKSSSTNTSYIKNENSLLMKQHTIGTGTNEPVSASSIAFIQDLILSIEGKDQNLNISDFEDINGFQSNQENEETQDNFKPMNENANEIVIKQPIVSELSASSNKNQQDNSNLGENKFDTSRFFISESQMHPINFNQYDTGCEIESGFTTANMKKIFIDSDRLKESKIHFGLSSQSNELFDFSNKIDSGFTTGNNKKIYVDVNDIPQINNENIPTSLDKLSKNTEPSYDKYSVRSPLKNLVIDEKLIENKINMQTNEVQLLNKEDYNDSAQKHRVMNEWQNNQVIISKNVNKIDCNPELCYDNKANLNQTFQNPATSLSFRNVNTEFIEESISLNKSSQYAFKSEISAQMEKSHHNSSNKRVSSTVNYVEKEHRSNVIADTSKVARHDIAKVTADYEIENSFENIKNKTMQNPEKNSSFQPLKKYNTLQQPSSTKISNEDKLLIDTYATIREIFKKQEEDWIFTQFKWTWMHLLIKNELKNANLTENIAEIMKLRLKYEHSVLRRLVEFDDIPGKFLILGIISYNETTAELFDGFYSLNVEIDKSIFDLFKKHNCTLGSKIFIFGSQLLLKTPTSIFDVRGPVLKLFFNSVKVCSNDFKLGSAHKATFINEIASISESGGVISCLIVQIKRIIETKYLVTVESYRNRVDDLEKEIEKILEIADKTNHKIDMSSIKSTQYTKAIVSDSTGECLLTWWDPPEIKINECYKLIYLTPVSSSIGLHVSASRKTYWEKIKQ